jgi:hypothetical protein
MPATPLYGAPALPFAFVAQVCEKLGVDPHALRGIDITPHQVVIHQVTSDGTEQVTLIPVGL